jgi:hypothetical protein
MSQDQRSTTAQNRTLPARFRPNCEQCFLISGVDLDAEEDEARIFKLSISPCGKITFVFRRSDSESPVAYPVFDGSSVTWITFHRPC